MNKYKQFLAGSVLLTATIFYTSCKKDTTAMPQSPSDQTVVDSLPQGGITDALPVPVFVKQLTIEDNDGKSFVFEFGSNDAALLEKMDKNSISVLLNPTADPTKEESHADKHTETNPNTNMDNRKFVSIQLLGSPNSGKITSYRLIFKDDFKKVMRVAGAATKIKLTPNTVTPLQQRGYWWTINWCSKVGLYGDGGVVQTGVATYGVYRLASLWREAWLHNQLFWNYESCSKCYHGCNWISGIWVFQDVLTWVDVYSGC
jgi:hypothetical protein